MPKTEQIEKVQPNGELSTVAFLAKSLSDENRLRILLFLSQGKESVTRIVEELNLSQPLVSHHLKELKRSLLVKVERQRSLSFTMKWRIKELLTYLRDMQVLANSAFSQPENILIEEMDFMSKKSLQQIVDKLAPRRRPLKEMAAIIKKLFPLLEEQARLDFVMNLIGDAGNGQDFQPGPPLTGRVHGRRCRSNPHVSDAWWIRSFSPNN